MHLFEVKHNHYHQQRHKNNT